MKILANVNKNISLTLAQNKDVKATGFSPKTVAELKNSPYTTIEGSIPGNFELDMQRAGLLPDVFYGTNPLKVMELEATHLWYSTHFDISESADENTYLRFEGIDTVSDIFLNGEKIGDTDNMFIAHEFNTPNLKEKDNELVVHIIPATIHARKYAVDAMSNAQVYNYDALYMRKAASMYGWDIMPRFVSGGIWKEVTVVKKPKERIEEIYLYTTAVNKEKNSAEVTAFFGIRSEEDLLYGMRIEIDGVCGDSSFHMEKNLFNIYGHIASPRISNAKLWWPKNYGEHPLYDVTARLYRGDVLLDTYTFKYGIRTVELDRTSVIDENGGKFCFKINGEPIFAMGSNWVPLDPFHSRDKERLPAALELLDDKGCNIVRCWGGNVYESDEFFDFCDSHGIMVWQDFALGCAVYPQNSDFYRRLTIEADFIIKRLRNRASLILWAGDNECDEFVRYSGVDRNPNENEVTRKVLFDCVRRNDFSRPYIPSSPYIDDYAYKSKKPLSEAHLWGPRDYFKGDYYRNAVCAFASETGYHGCPSPESLAKYIPQDKLWPMVDENGVAVDEWLAHAASMELSPKAPYAYRIPLMMSQVKTLFCEIPDNLADFSLYSQISQAEAKKYFIERMRMAKWQKCGIIWWNLLDGWPQISDAVVDYYYDKKLAYHYIKRSQMPLCLMFGEPVDNVMTLYGALDATADETVSYKVTRVSDGTVVAEGETFIEKQSSKAICNVKIADGEQECYHIEWTTESKTEGENHFYTNLFEINAEKYISELRSIGFIK